MISPLVSILMTSFNRERFIAESIESALASTFTDFELIIVDDGSTDNTVSIAQEFASRDQRVRIYRNEKNLGQFKNRNYVATLARGEYLKYLDSDDLLYPHGLQVLVEMMELFPEAGYGLCSLPQDNEKPYPFILDPEESYNYNFFNRSIFHKAPLSSIIRKESFDKIGGFDIEAVSGDYAFWLKIAQHYPVVLMPDGIAWYRVHAEQEMTKARVDKVVEFEYLKVIELYLKKKECPLPIGKKKLLLQKNHQDQLKFSIRSFIEGQFKSAMKINIIRKMDPVRYFIQA